MFFFFIGGIQPKTVTLDRQARTCPACGLAGAYTRRTDHYLSLFFIPLVRVKKGEPYLYCQRCIYPALLIADTLRLFGQGTKVAVEISIMAADAGTLTGDDIVAIGGTARGADTALVLKPANQSDLFSMRIREVICKPRKF